MPASHLVALVSQHGFGDSQPFSGRPSQWYQPGSHVTREGMNRHSPPRLQVIEAW
jgi:hypothetical protein